jgi:hypothetical protein
MKTCPFCNSENFGKDTPKQGSHYFLPSYDDETGRINYESGALVNLYSCHDCARLTFTSAILEDR